MSSSDKKKIVSIMKGNSSHAYLATCDGNQPIVRSMSAIVEDDMNIWMATSSNSRKVKQIKKNPKICLAFVKQPNGDRSAFVMGKVKIIDSLKEKKRIWKIAGYDMSQYFKDGPQSKEFCLLKVIPKKIEWWESWESGRKFYKPKKK
ncbi:MAG: pyridoxamine 5'-phosphate oxidase family protein [candidate division Zixibacteria bacterium]|nr:pyridoxamine 5'-phosphate oxidase family protein [candidate division Zixibacteria bacterium]